MIVLDTNVVSEPWKSAPASALLAWLDAQAIETLYLSAISVAELRYGIATMPAGKRKKLYHTRLNEQILPLFAGRVLAFDLAVSQVYAEMMAQARASGRTLGKEDGYIAATAAAHGFTVASRDIRPFQTAGVAVINPWHSHA